jgi:hypothetical protein
MSKQFTKKFIVAALVGIRTNMATYKALFISDVSATVSLTEDGQHAQSQPVSNHALERGERGLGKPRAKVYVAIFRSSARQDDLACSRGTIQ